MSFMNNTSAFKRIVATLSGMEAAEALVRPDTETAAAIPEVVRLMKGASSADDFSESVEDSLPLLSSIPIGLRFREDIPTVIDWARGDGIFLPSKRVPGVSAAIVMACSMNGITPGTWGGEVATVFASIDRDFVRVVDCAIKMAGEGVPPGDAMTAIRTEAFAPAFAVASALYCCAGSRGSYARAVGAAREAPFLTSTVLALSGAFMGAQEPEAIEAAEKWVTLAQDII